MTKRFALADTLPNPYFTIDAGAGAAVTVKTATMDDGRMTVEIWRDNQVLCRVFAASVTVEPPDDYIENPGGICVNCNKDWNDCKCTQKEIGAAMDRWCAEHLDADGKRNNTP